MAVQTDITRAFLKIWKAEASPFAKALIPVLRKQHKRGIERFRDFTGAELRKAILHPNDVALLYPPGQTSTDMMKVANDHIRKGYKRGAKAELSQVRGLAKRLPQISLELQDNISDAVDEEFNQDFWEANFGNSTRRRLANVLFGAVQDGWTLQETAEFLQQDKFGIFSKERATRIARTEMTAAMNGDGDINGLDIPLFTQALLAP